MPGKRLPPHSHSRLDPRKASEILATLVRDAADLELEPFGSPRRDQWTLTAKGALERTFGPDSSILAGFSASQSIVFKRGDSAENLRKVDNEKLASEVSVIRSAIQQLDWSIEGGKETATPGAKKLEPATMMIFISHSSHDVPLTTALIDLLRLAIPELQSGQIRCSDVPGYRFPGGVNTEERIRKEVNEAKIVIALVTPSSLRSVYVLFELGARWGANLRLIPLLAGVDPGELEEPLKPLNALSAHQNEELHQLVKDVARGLGMKQDDSAIWLPKIDVVKERADATQRGRHASETLILKRNDVDGVVGTVEERFDHAQEEVWISGNDNMFVARCLSGFLVKALRRRLKIRLLGVDPDSAAASMLSLIDPRFEYDNFRAEILG